MKKFLPLLLSLALLLSLNACGAKTEETAEVPEAPVSEAAEAPAEPEAEPDPEPADEDAEYGVIRKVGDKLYEVTYDTYADDFDTVSSYINEKYNGEAPGCTSVYKDGMLMRNLDWYIKSDGADVAELVIKTTDSEDRYASIGVVNSPLITDETYDSLTEEQAAILPFIIVDGMNSEGLMFGQNVCPETDGISNTYGTNPEGEELCFYLLGRQLLDNCADVDEAISFILDHNIVMVDYGNGYRMESHLLLADTERAVVVEFVDNQVVVLEQEDLPYEQTFITNHYLYNGGENTGHGMGYERDEVVKANYDSVTDWESGMALLEKLRYTQAYTLPLGEGFWYSEYYVTTETEDGEVHDFNADTPTDDPDFLAFIHQKQENYAVLDGDCWWSNHSSVYNSADGTLHLVVRENFDTVYSFTLN